MITRFVPLEEMKQLFYELFFNNTDKVTKISNESIINGVAYGVGKVGQKANKDIALVESHLFPEGAFGIHLDRIADRRGIAGRFLASRSSGLIRIVATQGTTYSAGVNIFSGNGVIFDLVEDITIGASGFAYAKVRAQSEGGRTNVPPLSISTVTPRPIGHRFVINEYAIEGGRDFEDDELFKLRIKKGASLASRSTLDYITAIFQSINNDILFVRSYGTDIQGRTILAIATQNGADLTQSELDTLSQNAASFLSIADYDNITNNTLNISLQNIQYEYVDIDIRADISLEEPLDQTRIEIQVAMSKYLDFRFWEPGQRVEWDNLLQIVKNHPRVRYVSDSQFRPNTDQLVPVGKLPRIRGFILRDLEGNILIDNNNILNPIYYPTNPDDAFRVTLLSDL